MSECYVGCTRQYEHMRTVIRISQLRLISYSNYTNIKEERKTWQT